MIKHSMRASLLATLVLASTAAVALAAHPIRGGVYTGTSARGGRVAIFISVSANGRTLTVNADSPPRYCKRVVALTQQATGAVRISGNGSFSGRIAYRFFHRTLFTVFFRGRFVKKNLVQGTLRSQFPSRACSGTTSFRAKPDRAL